MQKSTNNEYIYITAHMSLSQEAPQKRVRKIVRALPYVEQFPAVEQSLL